MARGSLLSLFIVLRRFFTTDVLVILRSSSLQGTAAQEAKYYVKTPLEQAKLGGTGFMT